jgi:hypothetical protein
MQLGRSAEALAVVLAVLLNLGALPKGAPVTQACAALDELPGPGPGPVPGPPAHSESPLQPYRKHAAQVRIDRVAHEGEQAFDLEEGVVFGDLSGA